MKDFENMNNQNKYENINNIDNKIVDNSTVKDSINDSTLENMFNNVVNIENNYYEQIKNDTRVGLKEKEVNNRTIRCRMVFLNHCTTKDKQTNTKRHTCINIVNALTGEYLADHTQIVRSDIFKNNFNEKRTNIIEFQCKVYKYKKGDQEDFSLEVIDTVHFQEDCIYNSTTFFDIDYSKGYNELDMFLRGKNKSDLRRIITNLKEVLNGVSEDVFGKDFIFYYIFNQVTLNTVNLQIKELDLSDLTIVELTYIIVLIGSTLYFMNEKVENEGCCSIMDIFKNIAEEVTVLQHVKNVGWTRNENGERIKSNNKNQIRKDNLDLYAYIHSTGKNVSTWDVVNNRAKNFLLTNEDIKFTSDIVIRFAAYVIMSFGYDFLLK